MLPRKRFENLHTVMAILVLFKQFLGKVCHILAPHFECFTNDAKACNEWRGPSPRISA